MATGQRRITLTNTFLAKPLQHSGFGYSAAVTGLQC